jgi:hypothetical protein
MTDVEAGIFESKKGEEPSARRLPVRLVRRES